MSAQQILPPGEIALVGGEPNPPHGSIIHPSQAIEIVFPFLLDLSSVNTTNVNVYDTILGRYLNTEGTVTVTGRNGTNRSILTIAPKQDYYFPWGDTLNVTLQGVKRSDGLPLMTNFGTLVYFVQEQECPGMIWSPDQLDLLTARQNTGIWKTAKEEIWSKWVNGDLFKNVAPMAYPTTPMTVDEARIMYNGDYNSGRGATDDSHYCWGCAMWWWFTGDTKYLDEARSVLFMWVDDFPVGPPTTSEWWYAIFYGLVGNSFIHTYELIRDQLTRGERLRFDSFMQRWAEAIQFGHTSFRGDSGDQPNNIRSWGNSCMMGVYGVTGDWRWRDYVLGTGEINGDTNFFYYEWMFNNAVMNENGFPRIWDQHRAIRDNVPWLYITYPIYHLEAMLNSCHHRFMADGKDDFWRMVHAATGWTMDDVTKEYHKAVRCEAGSGFEAIEGFCTDWQGDIDKGRDPVYMRLMRRMECSWKISTFINLSFPDESRYELILPENRGDFDNYHTTDVHIVGFGAPYRGYPAAGWPLGGPIQPPAPTNLQVKAERTWIKVTWDQPTPSDEYGAPLRWIITANGQEKGRSANTEFIISDGIQPNTTYNIRVKALHETGLTKRVGPVAVTTRSI